MICLPAISPRRAARVKRLSRTVGMTLSLGLVTASCGQHAPKGQVVAVVNGQDVTAQDLATEQRSANQPPTADSKPLLQRVIARVLLAQDAHARHLDSYPGFPSDLARLQQNFLAQKALQGVIKPPTKIAPDDLARFEASRPYAFARRMKVSLDEIRFSAADDLKSLNGADDFAAIESRLKSLNIQSQRTTRDMDTAQLPPGLAEKLATILFGQIFFIHEGDTALGLAVRAREPITLAPEKEAALATQAMAEVSTQQQIGAVLKDLRNKAKIAYQPGYAPTAPTAAKPATAPAPAG